MGPISSRYLLAQRSPLRIELHHRSPQDLSTQAVQKHMSSPSSPLFLFSLLTIILSIAVQTYSQSEANTPFVTDCQGDNFTLSSPFDSNLRLLVNGLIASTPNSPTFFSLYNSTSPQIFGLAQCRPDITPAVCTACLNQSALGFFNNQGCGLKKFFANRAENCLIRYSDQMFYGSTDERLFVYDNTGQNMSASFNRRVNILMKSVMASAEASALKFAVGVSNDSVNEPNIYGMAWCSMDLASSDCDQCLVSASERIPAGKNFGNGAYVSCNWRFETNQFYSNSTLSPPPTETGGKITVGIIVAIILAIIFGLVLITTACICFWRRRSKMNIPRKFDIEDITNVESLLFDLSTLEVATSNFSEHNKLGEGGFGSVYLGLLPDGREIAVKRLSKGSKQGLNELKNELILVAKLQHRNLVRLHGVCLEEQEKLLVYEYVPNKSLDTILFDPIKSKLLNWVKRYEIIEGIVRGLLYLHEESQLKIIHRDLKASNVLLDADMNPKISDFGMAKLFGVDETHGMTTCVVGTYGYMAPEYIRHGHFSIKSDVFSFGVLVLEIITGRSRNSFFNDELSQNLLSYVWENWVKGTILKIVDPALGKLFINSEVIRCIQIGLLCVQEDLAQRPRMTEVHVMLNSYSVSLKAPPSPAFFVGSSGINSDMLSGKSDMHGDSTHTSSNKFMPGSPNEVSISELDPR